MGLSDDRGQALQVGAILLFGILIVGLSLYQATVVPNQNERAEFESYLDANSDMEQLDSGIGAAAARDYLTRTAVTTGVNYPTRTVFVNPGPAGNRLRTSGSDTVRIENAEAVSGEAANTRVKWNGTTAHEYNTTTVRFDSNYNQLQAPSIVYESGVIYRPADQTAGAPYGPNESIVVSKGTTIEGNRITIVTLAGELDTGGLQSTVVARPVSAHTRTVVVTGNDSGTENITLTLPSELNDETWESEVLGDEINDESVLNVTQNGTENVDVILNGSRTYELRLAKIELRRQADSGVVDEPSSNYIVRAAGDNQSINANQSVRLTAEVRDRYNNPQSGTEVNFSTSDGTFEDNSISRTVTTDSEGRASVQFNPTPNETDERTVDAKIDGGASAELNTTTFTVSVAQGGGGSGGGGDGTASANPSSNLASLIWEDATSGTQGNDQDVSVTFNNTASSAVQITGVRYQFYSKDSQGGGGGGPPESVTIEDSDGTGETSPINYVGTYVDVESDLDSISSGATPTYTFKFFSGTDESGGRFDADPDDFFLISLQFELNGETETATYFIGISEP